MSTQKLFLCLMALACLLVQAISAEDSPSANTYSDPAVNEMKNQVISEQKTTSASYKGQPWATSSLNESYKKVTSGVATPVQVASAAQSASSGNSLVEADSFLKGAAANAFYIMSVNDYLNRAKADPNWVIVDVRAADQYAQGHIQNALNVPLADLVSQMGMFPGGKKVVVYGDIDANAAFAVEILRIFANSDAYVLQGGLSAWQAAGMPVVT